jgi:ribosomal protein L35
MPKLKTKKTLAKRIKITSKGKILKKQTRTGHLKSKWDASKKGRKSKRLVQHNKGHIKVIKKLMAKAGRKIK